MDVPLKVKMTRGHHHWYECCLTLLHSWYHLAQRPTTL